jgi:hypothetical protein
LKAYRLGTHLQLAARRSKGTPGQSVALRMRSPTLRAGSPAAMALAGAMAFARHRTVRRDCSVSGTHCIGPMASSPTHCAPCGRSVQTVATKSDVDARCARWPWALRFSASHRRATARPSAPLRTHRWCSTRTACVSRLAVWRREPSLPRKGRGRVAGRAPMRRREAQGSRPRAQRASSTDSSRLSERSGHSPRSEFGDGP